MPQPCTVLVELNSLELGGTQINAIDLARAVRPFGYESVLFGPLETLPATGPSVLDVAEQRGVHVEGFHRSPGFIQGGARTLELRADAIGADIVHLYGAKPGPRNAYWGPCRFGRRPLVHTVYEMAVDTGLHQHTSLIIGTGYLHDELRDRPGATALISPPVDTDVDAPDDARGRVFRRNLGELAERTLIVIVSRLDLDMKAHPVETAIRAMALLADTDAGLVIVGSGGEQARLQEVATAVNAVAGRLMVMLVGPMADPRPAYAAADLSIGMGGSAARALAFGRPLIVHGERGTSEVFEPATAEDLFRRSFWSEQVQEDGPAVLAGLLRPLIHDADRRRALGAFGRRFAVDRFSLDAMALRLAGVYDDARRSYGRGDWWRDAHREARSLALGARRRLALTAAGAR